MVGCLRSGTLRCAQDLRLITGVWERQLARHEARQQQIPGATKILVLQVELIHQPEHRPHDVSKPLKEIRGRLNYGHRIEALLLHALATARTGHALDRGAANFIAPRQQVDEFWSEALRAEDDELR